MITDDLKIPWPEALSLVVLQIPYVYKQIRRKEYAHMKNLLGGCCYTASEAVYHLSSDPLEPWWLRYGEQKHQTHWFLRVPETGQIVDPTASQFPRSQPYYEYSRRRPFLTKIPSKRARVILDRIESDLGKVYYR